MIDSYIFKSACWLSCFVLIYLIFLRNERFFGLKRFYLLAGLILSIVLPIVTIHYRIPVADLPAEVEIGNSYIMGTKNDSQPANFSTILLSIYSAGVVVLLARTIWQVIIIFAAIRKNSPDKKSSNRVIRTYRFSSSFSFFNYIFINPDVAGNDLDEILHHELVHVKQKHWVDLVLAEIIRIIQWMNPFSWIYLSLIRKNHEYLADAGALMHSPNPAVYKAALLNQMFRTPVFSASNPFGYSLNRTRFDMMKRIVTSPYRKLKTFIILPVSGLLFYAFAEPVYVQSPPVESTEISFQTTTVDPSAQTLTSEDNPVTDGVITGEKPGAEQDLVPSGEVQVMTGEGVVEEITTKMEAEVDPIKASDSGTEVNQAGESEIPGETPFVVVENMPKYPGGDVALLETVSKNTRYPENARQNGIEGRVIMRFVVTARGKVDEVVVLRGVDPELDKEAIRVVSMLDNFIPGTQGGKAVPVYYMIPITFTLPGRF